MQVKFDWSDTASSQKWSTAQEVYVYTMPYLLTFSPTTPGTENFDYGYDIITKKERVRGEGKAFRVRFTSSTGKDMRLLGWALSISGVTIQ